MGLFGNRLTLALLGCLFYGSGAITGYVLRNKQFVPKHHGRKPSLKDKHVPKVGKRRASVHRGK